MTFYMPPTSTVELQQASKWYGDVIGVNQVTLSFGPGVTGLLGPNGAGKSTMMRLITGQLKPGSGTVTVLGKAPWKRPAVFRDVGYCPDSDALYDGLTALQFTRLMGRLSGMSASEARKSAIEQLERVELTQAMDRSLRGYSKGMRQRTKIAAALMTNPQVLILDEPLNGLDPLGRRQMLQLFAELGRAGRTVVISSHILHEIESLTPQVALIHHGRILAEGKIEEIRALIENQPLTLQIDSSQPRAVGKLLADLPGIYSIMYPDGNAVVVRTNLPEELYVRLQAGVIEDKLPVEGLHALDENLEAVFQYLVKE